MSKKKGLFGLGDLSEIGSAIGDIKKNWDDGADDRAQAKAEAKAKAEAEAKKAAEEAAAAATIHEEKMQAALAREAAIQLTTGEFKQPHEIIDVISVVSSAQGARRRPGLAGMFESDQNEAARQSAFEAVKGQARLQAAYMGGDGVQNIQFSHAKAMTQAGGLNPGQHIWSFFAYGTVVKLK